jgi:tetratricopeptide (TPR) repeat protein
MQRARQSETSFDPSADEMADIGRICRLVEGMPLALELSAPWIKVINCQEIAGEIQRSLDFLTTSFQDVPERHRSLRVVFEQTWERLSTAERTVLKQLSVFRSGCTREAAELVTGATLPVLASLVDKALLRRTNLGRYEMHELLRQYTSGRLEASGQCETAQEAHCFYFTNFLHHREADLKGRRQVAALNEIESDFDNVRAAWQWAVSCKKYEVVGRALESICLFCVMRNRYQGCLELLRLGQEQLAPAAGERPHPIWGRILARAPSPARVFLEPLADVRARVEIALTIAREHGDQAEVAFCLWRLGVAVLSDSDNFSEALACCEQSLTLYQALDDRFYQAKLLDQAGIWCLRLNQSERGARLIQQGASLHRDLGDKIGLSNSLGSLGWIAYHCGQYAEAEANWQEGYLLACETGDRQESALMLMGTAWLTLFNRGDFAAAHALAEEVQAIALEINSPEGRRRAQILFGFLAGMNEDYAACQQLMQQAAYQRNYTYNISWIIMGLCLAACGLGEVQTARQHLEQALEMSQMRNWQAVMAQCLPFAAIIKANAGEVRQAVRLMALAFSHPLSPKGWLDKWPLLMRLRAELEAVTSPVDFATAWEQGQALDLEATVQMLLEEDSSMTTP